MISSFQKSPLFFPPEKLYLHLIHNSPWTHFRFNSATLWWAHSKGCKDFKAAEQQRNKHESAPAHARPRFIYYHPETPQPSINSPTRRHEQFHKCAWDHQRCDYRRLGIHQLGINGRHKKIFTIAQRALKRCDYHRLHSCAQLGALPLPAFPTPYPPRPELRFFFPLFFIQRKVVNIFILHCAQSQPSPSSSENLSLTFLSSFLQAKERLYSLWKLQHLPTWHSHGIELSVNFRSIRVLILTSPIYVPACWPSFLHTSFQPTIAFRFQNQKGEMSWCVTPRTLLLFCINPLLHCTVLSATVRLSLHATTYSSYTGLLVRTLRSTVGSRAHAFIRTHLCLLAHWCDP